MAERIFVTPAIKPGLLASKCCGVLAKMRVDPGLASRPPGMTFLS